MEAYKENSNDFADYYGSIGRYKRMGKEEDDHANERSI